jgi:hypothetical protein
MLGNPLDKTTMMEHRLIGNNKKNSNYIKLGKEEELKS